jgi:hypothetical protein
MPSRQVFCISFQLVPINPYLAIPPERERREEERREPTREKRER